MTTKSRSLLHLKPQVLAEWLERHGVGAWWSVDGDDLLAEQLSFPCQSDGLATVLRTVAKDLVLLPPGKKVGGSEGSIRVDQLEDMASRDRDGNRIFLLRWADSDPSAEWILAEDKEIEQISSSSAQAEEG